MTNSQLARREYELWNSGGIEASIEHVWAPDIVYHESPEQPDTGVFEGVEAMVAHLRELQASGQFHLELRSVEEQGEWTLSTLEISLEGASSGVQAGTQVFHVSRWRADRIQEMRSFFDADQARGEFERLSGASLT